jgi:SAM-dependent methyltransferase
VETAVTEELFDLSEEYEAMLQEGIRLSGEGMLFFLDGRLSMLQNRTPDPRAVVRVLDFGCGLGYATKRLREMFPQAEITGVDTSEKALGAARQRHGGPGIRFLSLNDIRSDAGGYDLCYINGVLHHIPREEQPEALDLIHRLLRKDGVVALFENNPWNIGAHMVMARIRFDRDAHMLSPLLTASLLRKTGFDVTRIDSLFFFPRVLKALRFVEPFLSWTRLGAQYLVLGAKR